MKREVKRLIHRRKRMKRFLAIPHEYDTSLPRSKRLDSNHAPADTAKLRAATLIYEQQALRNFPQLGVDWQRQKFVLPDTLEGAFVCSASAPHLPIQLHEIPQGNR